MNTADNGGNDRRIGENFRHGKTEAARSFPASVDEKLKEEYPDVVHHQGGNDFVEAAFQAQKAGNESPDASGHGGGKDDGGQHDRHGELGKGEYDPCRSHCPQRELSLRADVPYLHAECDGDAQRAQKDGNHLEKRILKGNPGTEAPFHDYAEGLQRRLVLNEQQQAADREGEEQAAQKNKAFASPKGPLASNDTETRHGVSCWAQ